MATLTQRKPRVKPARSAGLTGPYTDGGPRILSLTVGKEVFNYFLYPESSDFGRAFRLEKFSTQGGERYDVLLDGKHSSCECKGFLRWNHCKHIESLTELVKAGRI